MATNKGPIPTPKPPLVVLTGAQIAALAELAADEPSTEIAIGWADAEGHSGPGLYAWYAEYPDEGAVALFDRQTEAAGE